LEGIADGPLPQQCKGKQPGESPVACVSKGPGSPPAKLFMEPRGSSALHYASVISALDIAGDSEKESWAKLRSDELYQGLVKAAESLAKMNQAALLESAFKELVVQRAGHYKLDPEDAWSCFLAEVSPSQQAGAPPGVGDFTQETILAEEF